MSDTSTSNPPTAGSSPEPQAPTGATATHPESASASKIVLPSLGASLPAPKHATCRRQTQHFANIEWQYSGNDADLTDFFITAIYEGEHYTTQSVSKQQRNYRFKLGKPGKYSFEIVARKGGLKSSATYCAIEFKSSWASFLTWLMQTRVLITSSVILAVIVVVSILVFKWPREETAEDIRRLDEKLYAQLAAETQALKNEQKTIPTNQIPPPTLPKEYPAAEPVKTLRIQEFTAPIPDAVITKEIKYVTIKSMTSVEILVSEQKFPVLSIPTEFRDALQIWWDGISAPTPDHNGNIYFSKFPDRIILGNRTEEDVTIMLIWTPKHKLKISPK